jgi:predicted enzyme related to lactoylglutathione lyase
MPNPVVHFEATGKDGAKIREFYGKVFGWSFNVMPEMDYGIVDNGGKGINGGIGGTGDAPDTSAVFYVAVADPQATLDRAEQLGGKTAMPVMEIPNIVTLAQFRDPAGNLVGVVEDDPNMQPPPSSAPPATNPVTWFEITGKDGKALREFYTQLLGWQYNFMPGGEDYGMIEAGDQGISGGIGGSGDQPPHAAWYVEVADPAASLDQVTANGGKVVVPATDMGIVVFGNFTDPEGNLVGVFKSNG